MKKGRRLLAILMAICLVCAYMPVSAFGVEGMKLKFSAAELAHGSVSYKIGDADYVDVDEATKDASGAIWIDLSSDSKGKMIYIKVTPEDSFAVNNIVAKEGDADSANPAYGGNFDKETGVYSFVLDSVIYPVEIGISKVDESSGDDPGGGESGGNQGEANQKPDNFGKVGYISFDTNGTDGRISYQCSNSINDLTNTWKSVEVDTKNSDWYSPIAKSSFENTSEKVFFRIERSNSKHLDVDGAFRILDENHQSKYTVLGTYNDDPNYNNENNGAQPSGKIGLKDMYDNTNDYYIIPVDRSLLIDDSIRYVEFRWIDVMPISVEIDEASQYMIANGKTEIGIASGKGFGISVQNGSNVSIPLLEDTDLEGKEERYLIDLKVNRNYFIPELSINGNVYQTFDTGGGGDGYTNIAVAVPAKEFKSIVAESKGSIVIHLTVDKNVSVEKQDVQASFNMISNGTIPDGVSMENLDANVVLSATDSTLTEDEIAEGAARAFDITMSVESKPETEFLVPIDISIDGNFSGDENNYSVIREHEGETPQVLECHVEKGEDNDILTFSTSKFSKFTIVYKENSSNSSGGITVIPSVPSDNTITNSGSGSDASTSVDVSDKTTVTDSKAETKVDADLGNKIVENALKNNSTDVVINAGTSAGDSAGSTVTLPESTVKALAKDTEASVTIKTDSAEVSLDKDAVAAVAAQAGSEGEVKLVVETKEQNKNKVEIELTLVTSNGTVSSFNGGTVTVTVPVSQELADKKVVCVYIDENGKYHKVDGAINEAGTHYTFTTGHFSTYAVMAEEDAEAVIKQQTADEQKAKIKKVKATVILSTKELKKGIRVTVKVPEVQKADKTGIIIYRSTKKDAKTYAVYKKVATKGSTYIIRNTKNVKGQKLTSGKKYYYKVRAYKVIDGKTYYGSMSAVKYIKAK